MIWLKFLCVLSRSVMSSSLPSFGQEPARLLCPQDFPVKNTGVGCHFLLQGIFLTQRLNPCLLSLLRCRWNLYLLSHWGSPAEYKIIHRNRSSKPKINCLSAKPCWTGRYLWCYDQNSKKIGLNYLCISVQIKSLVFIFFFLPVSFLDKGYRSEMRINWLSEIGEGAIITYEEKKERNDKFRTW